MKIVEILEIIVKWESNESFLNESSSVASRSSSH